MSEDASRRDHLALVRTDLANERTLLAYGRTSLMMAATGLTAVKFFPEVPGIITIGSGMAGVAVLIAVIGGWRFASLRRRVRQGDAS